MYCFQCCVDLFRPVDLRAEKGDHRTTLQGCPLERQRCAMAAFSGLSSLLWSGRAQGSEGRAGLGVQFTGRLLMSGQNGGLVPHIGVLGR